MATIVKIIKVHNCNVEINFKNQQNSPIEWPSSIPFRICADSNPVPQPKLTIHIPVWSCPHWNCNKPQTFSHTEHFKGETQKSSKTYLNFLLRCTEIITNAFPKTAAIIMEQNITLLTLSTVKSTQFCGGSSAVPFTVAGNCWLPFKKDAVILFQSLVLLAVLYSDVIDGSLRSVAYWADIIGIEYSSYWWAGVLSVMTVLVFWFACRVFYGYLGWSMDLLSACHTGWQMIWFSKKFKFKCHWLRIKLIGSILMRYHALSIIVIFVITTRHFWLSFKM